MEHIELKPDSGTQTLATSIAARLRGLITDGEIAPGEKLRLDDLRASFGVSLSPLREALSRLSAEGFVVMEDQRGYRAAPVSEKNMVEVTRLRAQMEPFALREAIRQGDDQWEGAVIASLYRLNKLQKMSPTTRMHEWEVAHRDLHQRLLSVCGMPLLMQFCSTLHDLSDRYRRLFLEQHPIDRDTANEHENICMATVERRADDAAGLLRDHIERTGTNIMRVLLERQKSKA